VQEDAEEETEANEPRGTNDRKREAEELQSETYLEERPRKKIRRSNRIRIRLVRKKTEDDE
jgi:hypothetical protein